MSLSRKARRHLSWTFLIICGLAVGYVLVFAEGGYITLKGHQKEMESLRQENLRLRQESGLYWDRIEKIKNDPKELERLMREKDYARPDEVVIHLPDDPPEEPDN